MNRDELCGALRERYTPERGFGLTFVPDAGYRNIPFVVPPPPPEELPERMPPGDLGRAVRILQRRPHWREATQLDNVAAYLFMRTEALSSSRMEGTWSTIDNILTPGELYDEGDAKSERQSIRGYAEALEYGCEQVGRLGLAALTTEFVCKLHSFIMSKEPDFHGIPGGIRRPGTPGSIVQIGGPYRKEDSVYNPAPPEYVARCLERVLSWMRDEIIVEMGNAGMGMPLPARMAIGHAHFEAVHPFNNGNGRVGRILWALQMSADGHLPLYLSGFIEQHREQYVQALQAAQKRLVYSPIVKLVSEAIIASSSEEATTKKVIRELPDLWLQRGKFRKNSAAIRALEVIVKMPILTAGILAEQLQVSVPAATNAVNSLHRQKILRERTGFRRNRVFAAEEVISVLARPFGMDPEIALEASRNTLGIE